MAASDRPWRRTALRTGLRWLYFAHRWLGVGACLFFAMWFGSGLVMMYVPFPAYSAQERLEHLPTIEWSKVRLSPGQALKAAGADRFPGDLRLEMLAAEPVYRFGRNAVSAVDGRPIDGVDAPAAQAVAEAYAPGDTPTLMGQVQRDQWTVAGGYDARRPFYLFDLHDEDGGRVYVSQRTGEVALDTTRKERFWNWLGSVPHWLYPTVLRQNQPAWRQVVMWTSGVGIVSAATGLWIGVLRVRLRRRPGQPISPYRGWMKWHHWAGLLGGLFLTTWIVSGWWSVNPFRWFATPSLSDAALVAYAGHASPDFPEVWPAPSRDVRQARFYWLAGRPLVALIGDDGRALLIDPPTGAGQTLSDTELFAAARTLVAAPVASAIRQTEPDDYWYSHHQPRPLPVLKIAFADAARTWVYLDPGTGEPLDVSNASSRAYRWVFAGLHQLDFRFLIYNRPAWDVILWILSAAGIVTSVSGVVIGWRRLRRPRRPLRPHAG